MLYPMDQIKDDNSEKLEMPPLDLTGPIWLRWLLMGFGWLMVATGIVGIIVPGLPTTVFLIIALWAFSKSSYKFQTWLWTHKHFGPPVRDWFLYGVLPVRAKILAVFVMTLSFIYLVGWIATDWVLPTIAGVIMLATATYIVTRRSHRPKD